MKTAEEWVEEFNYLANIYANPDKQIIDCFKRAQDEAFRAGYQSAIDALKKGLPDEQILFAELSPKIIGEMAASWLESVKPK